MLAGIKFGGWIPNCHLKCRGGSSIGPKGPGPPPPLPAHKACKLHYLLYTLPLKPVCLWCLCPKIDYSCVLQRARDATNGDLRGVSNDLGAWSEIFCVCGLSPLANLDPPLKVYSYSTILSSIINAKPRRSHSCSSRAV